MKPILDHHLATHHHPFHCVMPPHILDSIILKGTSRQRERALRIHGINNSLGHARVGFDESMRATRQALRQQRLVRAKSALEANLGGQAQRTIYTANNTNNIPGSAVRTEGASPTGDRQLDEAYFYMGATYDFFWEVFTRNSIDDEGMPLNGTVHYGREYDNAFWDGQQMIFGDGDGEQFQPFTRSVDVIGHELTHGITQNEAGLIYWKQAGALNEHISDVFGSLIKQYLNKQKTDQADWLIGAELFMPGVKGVAIRSMKAPGTAYGYPVPDPVLGRDPQPAHMRNYVNTIQDSGGVHINSGIPNHAFYLAAVSIGGYAWETVGRIWYEALRSPLLGRTTQFRAFARLTVTAAQQLFGATGSRAQAVRQGWAQVGIMA
jgi:Zn-dependent metalloprotease